MAIKNAVENGRRAREIWAKRLGHKVFEPMALNSDGTRQTPIAKPEVKPAVKPEVKPMVKAEAKK